MRDLASRLNTDLGEPPTELLRHVRREGVTDMARVPFLRFEAPVTVALPMAGTTRGTNFTPTTLQDVIAPRCIQLINAYIDKLQEDMRRTMTGEKRARPRALALGDGCTQPNARGVVWDLRGIRNSSIVPVDGGIAPHSDLRSATITADLQGWPDRELVDFVTHGVRYRAGHFKQTLLQPHLLALQQGWDDVNTTIEKHLKKGWMEASDYLPFWP
jgi:hypothetical protein